METPHKESKYYVLQTCINRNKINFKMLKMIIIRTR